MNLQVEEFEEEFYIEGRENLNKFYYLTCPVRNADEKTKIFLARLVKNYEERGYGIYYPKWDTNQDDPIGLEICNQNRDGIRNTNGVIKYISGSSEGSLFDDGIAFMENKYIKIINPEKLDECSNEVKDFFNGYQNFYEVEAPFFKKMLERKRIIKNSEEIFYNFKGRTPEFLFDFGMAFARGKPIRLLNRNEVKRTEKKSFENVLLELDSI